MSTNPTTSTLPEHATTVTITTTTNEPATPTTVATKLPPFWIAVWCCIGVSFAVFSIFLVINGQARQGTACTIINSTNFEVQDSQFLTPFDIHHLAMAQGFLGLGFLIVMSVLFVFVPLSIVWSAVITGFIGYSSLIIYVMVIAVLSLTQRNCDNVLSNLRMKNLGNYTNHVDHSMGIEVLSASLTQIVLTTFCLYVLWQNIPKKNVNTSPSTDMTALPVEQMVTLPMTNTTTSHVDPQVQKSANPKGNQWEIYV